MIKRPEYKDLHEKLALKLRLTLSANSIENIFEVLEELMILCKDNILEKRIQEFLTEFLADIDKLTLLKKDALDEINSFFYKIKKYLSNFEKISGLLAYDILNFEGLPTQDVYQKEKVLVELIQNLINDKSANHDKFLDEIGIFQKSKRLKNLQYVSPLQKHEYYTEINFEHLSESINRINSCYEIINNFVKFKNINHNKINNYLATLVILQNLVKEKAAIILLDAYLRLCYSAINSIFIHLEQMQNSDWFNLALQLNMADEPFFISIPKFILWSNSTAEFKLIEKKCAWYPFSRLSGFWLYKHKQLANNHPFYVHPTLNFPEFWNKLVYYMPDEIDVNECRYLIQRLFLDFEAYLIRLDSCRVPFWLYPKAAELIIGEKIITFEIGFFPFVLIEATCKTRKLSLQWTDIQENLIDTSYNQSKIARKPKLTNIEKQYKKNKVNLDEKDTRDKRKIRDAADCISETIVNQSGITDFAKFGGGSFDINTNKYEYSGIASTRLRNKLVATKNPTKILCPNKSQKV